MKKKTVSILVTFILVLGISMNVMASEEITPLASSRYCSYCGVMTQFVDCGTCRDFYPNTPYHCNACGRTFGTRNLCPGF